MNCTCGHASIVHTPDGCRGVGCVCPSVTVDAVETAAQPAGKRRKS